MKAEIRYIYTNDDFLELALAHHKSIAGEAPTGMEWKITKYFDEIRVDAVPIEKEEEAPVEEPKKADLQF
jgi:hypothetical protein